jgi:membrane-associated phospholipid phosphatase
VTQALSKTSSAVRSKALLAALVSFALFIALGVWVTRHGEPATLTGFDSALLNHSTLIAWWLTWACYPKLLGPLGVILLLLAWRFPGWRMRIIFSIVMLLLCWQGADIAQHLFARPRRLDWVVKHETAFSYPSSHAAIAAGFYVLWAAMLYMSELPRVMRTTAATLLLLLSLAIYWSRLALGAHYVTDLIGGALLGLGLVCAGLAIFPRAMMPPVAGRASAAAE